MITESNVEPLAQNKVDEHRATGSAQIAKALCLKSFTFTANTSYVFVWILLFHCTSNALRSHRGNELVQNFVCECESLILSYIRVLVLENSSPSLFRHFQMGSINECCDLTLHSQLVGIQSPLWIVWYTMIIFSLYLIECSWPICFPNILNKSCLSYITVFSLLFFLYFNKLPSWLEH